MGCRASQNGVSNTGQDRFAAMQGNSKARWVDRLSSSSGQPLRGLLQQTTKGRRAGVKCCAGPVSETVATQDTDEARWSDGLSSSSGQLLCGLLQGTDQGMCRSVHGVQGPV